MYVFEGMRAQMFDQVFRWDLFGAALGLNLIYLLIGIGTYLWSFAKARELGLLLQVGE
jgi:ABC-2 type transport system permease protein